MICYDDDDDDDDVILSVKLGGACILGMITTQTVQ